MNYDKGEGSFKSFNGIDNIAYSLYKPEGPPRAILQVAHGMSEHFGRYNDFAGFMARRGILVCGNDHLGHGKSASKPEDLGYFGRKDGWCIMVEDLHLLTLKIKGKYPGVPVFLLGHSMGSLLTRAFLTRYGAELNGVILMGTSGQNKMTKVSLPLLKSIRLIKGERHRSRLVYMIAFGTYNRRYPKGSNRLAWMSQDREVLNAFRSDPLCNFVLTVAGFFDLMRLLEYVSRREWARQVPKDLPIHLVSGDMDPVGDFGKGVQEVYKALLKENVKNLSMKLYPNDRHEILNEPRRDIVYHDILHWIEKHI